MIYIKSIKAKVIYSFIKVIVDRPVIRSHHLVRKIPSYFDEVESPCQSNQEARRVHLRNCHSDRLLILPLTRTRFFISELVLRLNCSRRFLLQKRHFHGVLYSRERACWATRCLQLNPSHPLACIRPNGSSSPLA